MEVNQYRENAESENLVHFDKVDVPHLCGWGRKDPSAIWLDTLKDVNEPRGIVRKVTANGAHSTL